MVVVVVVVEGEIRKVVVVEGEIRKVVVMNVMLI